MEAVEKAVICPREERLISFSVQSLGKFIHSYRCDGLISVSLFD